jgi:hypothetical protein
LTSKNPYVDTAALLEEGADGPAATLGGDEDDVDVLGRDDLGVLLEHDGEAVGEVEGLALGQVGLDVLPGGGLSGVGEEVHDDGTLLESLVDGEEGLAGDLLRTSAKKNSDSDSRQRQRSTHPAILLGELPALAALTDADNDVEAVVTSIQPLTVT